MHKGTDTKSHTIHTHTYTNSILTDWKLFRLMAGDRLYTLHFNTLCMVPVKAI